ncbi:MAG: heavy metal sensor histidine kinase [Nitrospira sp.]|nr:heavy metal sensor histidine kinase [Nitrospira sp.]
MSHKPSALRPGFSIRVRLTLWYGTALALSFIVFAVVLYAVMARGLREQVDHSLETAAAAAVRALEQHGVGPTLPFEDLAGEFPELAVLDKFFQIFSPAGKVTIQSPNVRRHDIPLSRVALEAAFEGQATFESARFRGESPIRLLSVPIRRGRELVNVVQVGASLHPVEQTLRRMLGVFGVAIPLALIVALAGGWFLAGRALKPVEAITQAAQLIAAGDLTQRLTVPRSADEIGRLTATFNDMIARLDASFQQVRRFSADASHELRTPLTVMKGETELALRRPRSAEDYRLVLESSLEEIDRMSRIVEELLFLARADLGEVKMESKPVRLDTLVEDIQRQAIVLGQESQVQAVVGAVEPVTVLGDELRLRELVLNLVDNAIKYSQRGGAVELRLSRDQNAARLVVADQGIGIPPEAQTRIFDRFYRTDEARAHAKKGTGLGLSICKWIVEAHQGRIEVRSALGQGAQFTIVLPLAPA